MSVSTIFLTASMFSARNMIVLPVIVGLLVADSIDSGVSIAPPSSAILLVFRPRHRRFVHLLMMPLPIKTPAFSRCLDRTLRRFSKVPASVLSGAYTRKLWKVGVVSVAAMRIYLVLVTPNLFKRWRVTKCDFIRSGWMTNQRSGSPTKVSS